MDVLSLAKLPSWIGGGNGQFHLMKDVVCANSLVLWFNVETCDIWEENLTTRSEIWYENVHSPCVRGVQEGVALRRSILWNVEYMTRSDNNPAEIFFIFRNLSFERISHIHHLRKLVSTIKLDKSRTNTPFASIPGHMKLWASFEFRSWVCFYLGSTQMVRGG